MIRTGVQPAAGRRHSLGANSTYHMSTPHSDSCKSGERVSQSFFGVMHVQHNHRARKCLENDSNGNGMHARELADRDLESDREVEHFVHRAS